MPPGPNGGKWTPTFNWDFNLGHVAMIVVFIATTVSAYQKTMANFESGLREVSTKISSRAEMVDARLASEALLNELKLDNLESKIDDIEEKVVKHEDAPPTIHGRGR